MLSWKRAEVLLALGVGDGIRSGVDVRVVVGWVVWGHCALLRGIVASGMIVTGAAPNTATVTCGYKQVHIVILWADQHRCSDWLTFIEIESSFGDCCMLMLRVPIPSKSCWRDWVSVSFTISPPNASLLTTCTAGGLRQGSTVMSNEPVEPGSSQWSPEHWLLVTHNWDELASCCSDSHVSFALGVGDGIRSGVDVRVVVGWVVWGHCALLRGIVVSGMIVTGAPPNTATVTCRYKQVHIVILWADQYRCSDCMAYSYRNRVLIWGLLYVNVEGAYSK